MTTTREQRAIARATLDIGRKLGVGGASWAVTRVTAATPAASPTEGGAGTWAGYVLDDRGQGRGQALPGPAATVTWEGVAPSSSLALQRGDILDNGAGLRFRVEALDPTAAGYAGYLLSQIS